MSSQKITLRFNVYDPVAHKIYAKFFPKPPVVKVPKALRPGERTISADSQCVELTEQLCDAFAV